MGKQTARLDMGVLAMISEMDVDNADSFEELKKQAMQQFEEEVSKTGEKRAVKGARRSRTEAVKKRGFSNQGSPFIWVGAPIGPSVKSQTRNGIPP